MVARDYSTEGKNSAIQNAICMFDFLLEFFINSLIHKLITFL